MESTRTTKITIDIGNTHSHIGWNVSNEWEKVIEIPTKPLIEGNVEDLASQWTPDLKPDWAAFCSVVPKASTTVRNWLNSQNLLHGFRELNHTNILGIGIDYPQPESIGPDRLANAMAAAHLFGAPSVVVDFGTAVTFDVVDKNHRYVGGIIAPGISVMTDYLHEKTALLPRIKINDPGCIIGKNTEQAMQIGAVHGYRGLIKQLIEQLRHELDMKQLPVVGTGGYAELIAGDLECITTIQPNLTLQGLLLMD